jgi:hypothetical protein
MLTDPARDTSTLQNRRHRRALNNDAMLCINERMSIHICILNSPTNIHWIPKPDGRKRPIGIAVLKEKIVQQAVAMVLNQIFEVDFLGFS